MIRIAIMLGVGLASGCMAEFVERRPRRRGPVPEVLIDAGGGHLRYSLRGPALIVLGRRKDAFEKIAEFCGGETRYKIVDEVARVDTAARYVGDDLEDEGGLSKTSRHYESRTVQHLYFECEK